LNLAAVAEARAPLFRRISQAIVGEIRRGRLRPGERLPGSRALARTLQVNRNTVLAAYEELAGEGWTDTARASGTFVSRALPEIRPATPGRPLTPRTRPSPTVGFELRQPPDLGELILAGRPGMHFSGSVPDVRLAPAAELARAFRRAVLGHSRTVLSYGHPQGHPRLRAALAAMLSASRGLASGPGDVIVTSGSQMAIDLVSRALLRPGDIVAVEQLGYRPAWLAFRQHGARLRPVPVDAGGLDVQALATLAERTSSLRAVYVTPHHQYPTTATLTAARRIALLELARRKRFAVIEDDYDHEFHYDGRPVLPLASSDQAGVVIYVGTLAKILAPGVRLGYVVAPEPLLQSLTAHRFLIDRQGDHTIEYAVAELLEEGAAQRHARRARRIYQARRDFLAGALRRELPDALSFDPPAGGIAIWATAEGGIDVDRWAARALDHELVIATARRFAFDGRARPHMRLSFAAFSEEELSEAVARLRRAL
ncbi:MAG TPA: PLP-dependent aminotransferase family protein, partial [Steroidobacteraceae bacterium]|nr:PLP-dependent aminotransferase family protein [Steroidobacteraceae bacterium]